MACCVLIGGLFGAMMVRAFLFGNAAGGCRKAVEWRLHQEDGNDKA